VQCTGKWRHSGRETLASYEVGRVSAMVRSPCELEWREEKEGDRGFARRGGVQAAMSPKEEKGGGDRYRDDGKD